MIKTSILAVLMFTASIAFGGQRVSCTISDAYVGGDVNHRTYKAYFYEVDEEKVEKLLGLIGNAQQKEIKEAITLSLELDPNAHLRDQCVMGLCP